MNHRKMSDDFSWLELIIFLIVLPFYWLYNKIVTGWRE